jgi:hypothetical protein
MDDSNSRHILWALFVYERTGVELGFFDRGVNLPQEGRWLNFERYRHRNGEDPRKIQREETNP